MYFWSNSSLIELNQTELNLFKNKNELVSAELNGTEIKSKLTYSSSLKSYNL